jgi:hypothetical protein
MAIGFSDVQLRALTEAATPLLPDKRAVFLSRVAAFLEMRGVYHHARDCDVEAAIRSALSGLVHRTSAA